MMLLLIASPAAAQEVELQQPETAPAEAQAPAGGNAYRGVVPGGTKAPPHAPKKKNPVRVTWTGFQMRDDGGSRVFVQLTADAPFQVTEVGNSLHVTIKGARLNLRNNGRPLDTHFFATPVKSIHATEKGGEVVLVIETKGHANHSEKTETQGGYQFLMIDFPPEGASGESASTSTTTK